MTLPTSEETGTEPSPWPSPWPSPEPSPEPSPAPCQCAVSGISAPETCFVGDEDDITITGTCLDGVSINIPGSTTVSSTEEKNAEGHIVKITRRVKWTNPGEHTLSATCGQSSAEKKIKVYKVDIEWNGQIVTDGTVPRIVGQPIDLKAIIEPAPPARTTYLWSLPSKSIRNYHLIMRRVEGSADTQGQNHHYDTKACVEGVSELAKSASSILFHIYGIPQNTKATLKATISSREKQVSTDVVITRPSAFFRAFVGNGNPVVQIVNNNTVACGVPDLPLATDPRRGLRFEAEVPAFTGGTGQIAFIQLVDSQRTAISDFGSRTLPTTRALRLDRLVKDDALFLPFFGDSIVTIEADGENSGLRAADTPSEDLSGLVGKRVIDDSFDIYLLYKPEGGIWVVLRRLEWGWRAEANCHPTTRQWTLDSFTAPGEPGAQINSVNYDRHPVWDERHQDAIRKHEIDPRPFIPCTDGNF